jgi:Retrotransposon gag protein
MASNTDGNFDSISPPSLPQPMAPILTLPFSVQTPTATSTMPSANFTSHNSNVTSQSQISTAPNLINIFSANPQHGNGSINQTNQKSKFRMEPPRFHGSSEEDIIQWLTYYERACRVNSWETDSEQARYFPCFLSSAASLWFDNLENTATAQNLSSYTFLKAELIKAFHGQKNADAIEFTLRSRKMAPDESVSNYYHSMLNLCRRSNAAMPNEAIVRHLMFGLKPNLMKHIMLMENNTHEQFYKNATKVERTIQLTGNNPTKLTDITAKLTDLAKSIAAINTTPKVNFIQTQPQSNQRTRYNSYSQPDQQAYYNSYPQHNHAPHHFPQYAHTDQDNNHGYTSKQNIECFFCNNHAHIMPECNNDLNGTPQRYNDYSDFRYDDSYHRHNNEDIRFSSNYNDQNDTQNLSMPSFRRQNDSPEQLAVHSMDEQTHERESDPNNE